MSTRHGHGKPKRGHPRKQPHPPSAGDRPAPVVVGVPSGLPQVQLSITRRADHPWIFRKMCRPAEHAPGTIVEVVDASGAIVGTGIYNRNSQIAVRLLSEDPNRPADDAFIAQRLADAIRLRRMLPGLHETDACRLVHAEGDCLSGLIVDRYGSFVVIELFSHGWFRKLGWLMKELAAQVSREFGVRPDTVKVLVRADDEVQQTEGFRVRDFVAEGMSNKLLRVEVKEGPVRFRVDLRHGHKTGFFCDQRDNRARVAQFARGRRMLDCFSYTGGFSVRALAGGAKSSLAVDLDADALNLASSNASINGVGQKLATRHADVFDVLRDLAAAGETFGVIVLDPPKLTATKEGLDQALRAYTDMNRLAIPLLEPDGVLVSCSCTGMVGESALLSCVRRAASDAHVHLQTLAVHGAPPDHPVLSAFPEGRYLKAIYSRALAR
ncbi:MAG: class I SAM-dependent rRNA methyltransferase [Planctomycetota bacterium]